MKTLCVAQSKRYSTPLFGFLAVFTALLLNPGSFAQSAGPTNNPGAPTNITSGLVLWWSLDDTNGLTASDSSGHGNTGTLYKSPTSVAGQISNALSFDGASQYIQSGAAPIPPGATALTIACWIKGRAPGANPNGTIISSWGYSYGFTFNSGGPVAFVGGGSYSDGVKSSRNVDDGKWHYLAGTWDGATGSLYIDGSLDNAAALYMNTWNFSAVVLAGPANYYGYYSGIIDDVRIYNRALSAVEIANQYQWPTGGRVSTFKAPRPQGPAAFYIDYSAGSDTNDGLSTASPLQHHPYMPGWNSTYIHVPGDRFIFKGGVTWPNVCFGLSAGGTGSASDYYGCTNNWFSGPSYSPPVFDSGGPSQSGGVVIWCGANNVIFDGILFTDYYWNAAKTGSIMAYIGVGASTNVLIENCIFTNWSHDTLANGNQDGFLCVYGSTSTINPGCMASNCVMDGRPNGTDSGGAFYCFPVIKNCTIGNLVCGPLPNGDPCIVSGCTIGPLNPSFSGKHGAAIEAQGPTGTQYFFNNIIHDSASINIMIGGSAGPTGPAYIYNNIIYNSTPGCILLSSFNGAANIAYVWNNILDSSRGGSYSVLEETGGGGQTADWSYIAEQNNLEIAGTSGASGRVTTWIRDHNLNISSATAAASGLSSANLYAPTSITNATVGTGTNLASLGLFTTDIKGRSRISRTNLSWDIGAYQLFWPPQLISATTATNQ